MVTGGRELEETCGCWRASAREHSGIYRCRRLRWTRSPHRVISAPLMVRSSKHPGKIKPSTYPCEPNKVFTQRGTGVGAFCGGGREREGDVRFQVCYRESFARQKCHSVPLPQLPCTAATVDPAANTSQPVRTFPQNLPPSHPCAAHPLHLFFFSMFFLVIKFFSLHFFGFRFFSPFSILVFWLFPPRFVSPNRHSYHQAATSVSPGELRAYRVIAAAAHFVADMMELFARDS